MSQVLLQIDGVDTWVDSNDPRAPKPQPTLGPQTVFDPATFLLTMFTPAERDGFNSKPAGIFFAELIAASPSVDVASPTFRAYIGQAVQGGFLSQARADQVLAGTPAPQA